MWHIGKCPICGETKLIGYIACLQRELCFDCFYAWQCGELDIERHYQFSKN